MSPIVDREGRRNDPEWEGHGTLTGYFAVGCRCTLCRQCAREYARERTERNLRREVPETAHGTNGYSNYGCRCDVCKEAHKQQRILAIANRIVEQDADLLERLKPLG